jgi:Tol biopolymer transport system component
LVEHPANDFVMGWAPDGKSVLYASDRNGALGFWSIQIAEGEPHGDPKLVKPDIGPVAPLGFNGEDSFYYSLQHKLYDIYFTELDPEKGETVAPPEKAIRRSEGYNLTSSYSPDGSSVIVVHWNADDHKGYYQIDA